MFDEGAVTSLRVSDVMDAWVADAGRHDVVDLPGEVVLIARIIDQAQGMLRLRVGQLDRSGQATDRGMPVSTTAWLCANTGTSPGVAARQVHSARVLADVLPETGELLRAGEISTDQADHLCRAAGASAVTRQVAADDERALLDIVRPVPIRNLPGVLEHWRHVVDPVGGEGAEQTAYERRQLDVSTTFENMVAINGILDPVGGAAVLTAIGAYARPAGEDDSRSPMARRADALVQLARQALDSRELPDVAGERPHVTVTVDLATLTGRSTGPADLDRIGPISGRLARQIVCDAGLVRVVTDGPSGVLDVGRRTRTVGPALRRALNVRDRGCVFDPCDRPTSWCDAHHVRHWAEGGPTNLENLALLCPQHHRAVHQLGWTLTWGPDRRWHTHPPADEPHANPWTAGRRRRRRAP